MKSSELMSFESPTLGTLRGFIDKKTGEPWFLAAQVCRCLGIKNSAKAVNDLKQRMQVVEDWERNRGAVSNCSLSRGVTSSYSPKAKTITLQEGKTHTQLTIIPESWLYELIFASRKQSAIVFRAWVTHEVLPALRKHGEYRMEGKLIRKALTSQLEESGEQDRMHGHAYSTYTKLINKSVGLPNRNNRENLSDDVLEKIARRENLAQVLVAEGKTYSQVREIIENLNNEEVSKPSTAATSSKENSHE